MKLRKYLTEGQILNWLDKVVRLLDKRMLNAMNRNKVLLVREMEFEPNNFALKRTYKHRITRNTKAKHQEYIDEWFALMFGWKARSNHALFVNYRKANSLFDLSNGLTFPIKPEKVVWSNSVTDMTFDLISDGRDLEFGDYTKEDLWNALENNNYKEADIVKFLNSNVIQGVEATIKCNKYIWIDFTTLMHSPKDVKTEIEILEKLKLPALAELI